MSIHWGLSKIATVQFVIQTEEFPDFVTDEHFSQFSVRDKVGELRCRFEESQEMFVYMTDLAQIGFWEEGILSARHQP